jgi:hypothetical protein
MDREFGYDNSMQQVGHQPLYIAQRHGSANFHVLNQLSDFGAWVQLPIKAMPA